MALAIVEPSEPSGSSDATTAWLAEVLTGLADAVAACADLHDVGEVSDADRIDRITRLERLKAAAAALQAAESVRFARSQVEQQWTDDVDPAAIGRGIADQLALAGHVSPTEGSRRLSTARALWFDLPQTFALLVAGRISEYVATLVVSETRHLDAEKRRDVDSAVVAAGLEELGVRAAAALARKKAYQADPCGYTERGRTERNHRRVTLRPVPDTMALLTGYLPVEQGIACLAALKQQVAACKAFGDPRSRDQIMADTLVERLTGQTAASDVNIEVQFTMPLSSLLDPNDESSTAIPGHGPLPGPLARDILATSRGRKWWRRLFTAPATSTHTATDDTTNPEAPTGSGLDGQPHRIRITTPTDTPTKPAPHNHRDRSATPSGRT